MQLSAHLMIAMLALPAPIRQSQWQVYECVSQTHQPITVLETGDEMLAPIKLLTEKFGLERKELGPARLGICRFDRCVPFPVGDKPGSVRIVDGAEWAPLQRLVDALGGRMLIDRDAGSLLIDLAHQRGVGQTDFDKPIDLRLPDLTGKPVDLSSFRGKKIVLFAWASW